MTTAARRSAAVLLLSFGPFLASTLSPPDWSDPDWYTTADGLQWASRFTREAFAAEGFAPMAECGGRGALGRIIGGPSRMAVYVRGVEARQRSAQGIMQRCGPRVRGRRRLRPRGMLPPRFPDAPAARGLVRAPRLLVGGPLHVVRVPGPRRPEGAPWFVMENPQEHIPATEAVVTADRLGRPVRVHRGGARADGPLRVGDAVGMWMQAGSACGLAGLAATRPAAERRRAARRRRCGAEPTTEFKFMAGYVEPRYAKKKLHRRRATLGARCRSLAHGEFTAGGGGGPAEGGGRRLRGLRRLRAQLTHLRERTALVVLLADLTDVSARASRGCAACTQRQPAAPRDEARNSCR